MKEMTAGMNLPGLDEMLAKITGSQIGPAAGAGGG